MLLLNLTRLSLPSLLNLQGKVAVCCAEPLLAVTALV
jgi:hypothetical protein